MKFGFDVVRGKRARLLHQFITTSTSWTVVMTIASVSSATPSVDEAFKKKDLFFVVIMVYPPSNLGVCRFNQIQSATTFNPKDLSFLLLGYIHLLI